MGGPGCCPGISGRAGSDSCPDTVRLSVPLAQRVLAGILGTVLFSLVILAVGIVATSVVSAILVGLLVAFFALIVTATACLIRCLADCDD